MLSKEKTDTLNHGSVRKGIILAGGRGNRLLPMTSLTSKHLLPVFNKPLIYYPICTLMQAGIRDIAIVVDGNQIESFLRLTGTGKRYGISITYYIQENPDGIADALEKAELFACGQPACVILGDNIFTSKNVTDILRSTLGKKGMACEKGAVLFYKNVSDPKRFGVIDIDLNGKILSISEKPKNPKSNKAITGLYVFDKHVFDIAKHTKSSSRGEKEIVDVLSEYARNNMLEALEIPEEASWQDAGTPEGLLDAALATKSDEERQKTLVASPELVAFQSGWLSINELIDIATEIKGSDYGMCLLNIAFSAHEKSKYGIM